MSSNYFITNDKEIAQKKLISLFGEVIISDIIQVKRGYKITRISPKELYKSSVESQSEMDNYLKYLLSKLETQEVSDKIQEDLSEKLSEEKHKEEIQEDLQKVKAEHFNKVNKKARKERINKVS